MGSAWRFRRCPECDEVNAAGDLINHHMGAAWDDGSAETECPDCGYTGARSDFRVVGDDRKGIFLVATPPSADPRVATDEYVQWLYTLTTKPKPPKTAPDHEHRWCSRTPPTWCIDCGAKTAARAEASA